MSTPLSDMKKTETVSSMVKEEDKVNFEIWKTIKAQIDDLKQGGYRHKEKKQKSIQLTSKITESMSALFNLFLKYPDIKKEYDEYDAEIRHLSQYINESIEALEKCARDYFEAYFRSIGVRLDKVEFLAKNFGDQVGRKARITYWDEASKTRQQVIYFIKTHQHGSASGSKSIKPVDPKELFVYKVLEYIGLGPESHFFFNLLSQGGFYIATRDLGSSKPTAAQKSKIFKIYDTLKEIVSPEESFLQGVTRADIISRIFCLRDVTTNPSNFGFVFNEDEKKCKIFDFRIESQDTYEYIDIFKGFLEGNGMFNYFDKFLKFTLKDRSETERLKTAESVLHELKAGGKKMSLGDAVNRAYQEVFTYFNQDHKSLGITVSEEPNGDFNKYVKSIKTNLDKFLTGLQGKILELKTSSEKKILLGAAESSLTPGNSQLFQYQSHPQNDSKQELEQITQWLEKATLPKDPKMFLDFQLKQRLIKGYSKYTEQSGQPSSNTSLRFKFKSEEFLKLDVKGSLNRLLEPAYFSTSAEGDRVFVSVSVLALRNLIAHSLQDPSNFRAIPSLQ